MGINHNHVNPHKSTSMLSPEASSKYSLEVDSGPVKMSFQTEINAAASLAVKALLADLYTNPELACFREYISNGLDSHTRVENPSQDLHVDIINSEEEIIFQDQGIGMDLKDIEDHYRYYGNSNKTDDADQIGAYGVGSKVGLSVAKKFYVSTVKNERQVDFVVTLDRIDILDEKSVPGAYSGTSVTIKYADANSSSLYQEFSSIGKSLFEYPTHIFGTSPQGAIRYNGKPITTVHDISVASMELSTYDGAVAYVIPVSRFVGLEDLSAGRYNEKLMVGIGGVVYGSYQLFSNISDADLEDMKSNLLTASGYEALELLDGAFSVMATIKPGYLTMNSSRESLSRSEENTAVITSLYRDVLSTFIPSLVIHGALSSDKLTNSQKEDIVVGVGVSSSRDKRIADMFKETIALFPSDEKYIPVITFKDSEVIAHFRNEKYRDRLSEPTYKAMRTSAMPSVAQTMVITADNADEINSSFASRVLKRAYEAYRIPAPTNIVVLPKAALSAYMSEVYEGKIYELGDVIEKVKAYRASKTSAAAQMYNPQFTAVTFSVDAAGKFTNMYADCELSHFTDRVYPMPRTNGLKALETKDIAFFEYSHAAAAKFPRHILTLPGSEELTKQVFAKLNAKAIVFIDLAGNFSFAKFTKAFPAEIRSGDELKSISDFVIKSHQSQRNEVAAEYNNFLRTSGYFAALALLSTGGKAPRPVDIYREPSKPSYVKLTTSANFTASLTAAVKNVAIPGIDPLANPTARAYYDALNTVASHYLDAHKSEQMATIKAKLQSTNSVSVHGIHISDESERLAVESEAASVRAAAGVNLTAIEWASNFVGADKDAISFISNLVVMPQYGTNKTEELAAKMIVSISMYDHLS